MTATGIVPARPVAAATEQTEEMGAQDRPRTRSKAESIAMAAGLPAEAPDEARYGRRDGHHDAPPAATAAHGDEVTVSTTC